VRAGAERENNGDSIPIDHALSEPTRNQKILERHRLHCVRRTETEIRFVKVSSYYIKQVLVLFILALLYWPRYRIVKAAQDLIRGTVKEHFAVRRIGTVTGYIPKHQLVVNEEQLAAYVGAPAGFRPLLERSQVNLTAFNSEWIEATACQQKQCRWEQYHQDCRVVPGSVGYGFHRRILT
jgi:hypothetical protein